MSDSDRLPDSPGALAQRIREDVLQIRALLSRTRLSGEESPEHQMAQAAWAHRRAILEVLATKRGVTVEEISVSAVPAYDLIAAAVTVRARLAEAREDRDGTAASFLAATSFLSPAGAGTQLPDWSPEPPGYSDDRTPPKG
ncbi:hypothetical protein AB0958_19575 [Streptomyces sp. NPDC006655]|uniref:hypothetical protein n=1 Tax=Streptomyces sp. NPDC006655 TaxID=3156898 RepID=UPI003453541F